MGVSGHSGRSRLLTSRCFPGWVSFLPLPVRWVPSLGRLRLLAARGNCHRFPYLISFSALPLPSPCRIPEPEGERARLSCGPAPPAEGSTRGLSPCPRCPAARTAQPTSGPRHEGPGAPPLHHPFLPLFIHRTGLRSDPISLLPVCTSKLTSTGMWAALCSVPRTLLAHRGAPLVSKESYLLFGEITEKGVSLTTVKQIQFPRDSCDTKVLQKHSSKSLKELTCDSTPRLIFKKNQMQALKQMPVHQGSRLPYLQQPSDGNSPPAHR